MDWIESNGTVLRYEVSGQGTETLVLMHELGGALESWDLVLPVLRQHFRVLRYDQRGFGLSEKTRGTLALDTITGDFAGLLDGLGLTQPCFLMGSALGAGLAIAVAVRFPKRISRLVACNPATGVKGDPRRRAFMEQRAETVEREGMRAVVEQSLSLSYPTLYRDDNVARFEWYRRRWLANDPFGFAAINRMLPETDLLPELGRIACPTLVLAGSNDTIIPPAVVEPIAKAIPGSTYRLIDSGHFMAVQTPERLLEHVLPFLKGKQ